MTEKLSTHDGALPRLQAPGRIGLARALAAGLLAATLGSAQSQALPEEPRYRLKEIAPRLGSNIRRDAYTGDSIPLNRRYDQLTSEQQDLLRSMYDGLSAPDEPPYPEQGSEKMMSAIVKGQHALRVEGPLTMFVEVDANGDAQSVQVLKSPDERMTRYVAAVLMQQKFKPAVCGGVRCTMAHPLRLTFRLEH